MVSFWYRFHGLEDWVPILCFPMDSLLSVFTCIRVQVYMCMRVCVHMCGYTNTQGIVFVLCESNVEH